MSNAPPCIVIDFETFPIRSRPGYPPRPVGFAIQWPDEAPRYWAFSHPIENNCAEREAKAELERAWRSGLPLLAHNQKFDAAVAQERWGFPKLPWRQMEDTMFLAYLCDPHGRSMGLKPLAEDLLGWPPQERDELDDWIWNHRKELEATYGGTVSKKKLGAWIFATPGDICGRYALGDIARTRELFKHLWPIVQENGMGPAYDRERQCLPIFMQNEEVGMRTDLELLEYEIVGYGSDFEYVEDWLRKELRASGLNFDADMDVANVLIEQGVVPEQLFTRTKATNTHPNGQLSMSKDNLMPSMFVGRPDGLRIASALGYRNRLKTCLDMFMRPWAEQARQMNGYVTTNWNQTRSAGQSGGGTRTGRPSTDNHNFLNLSKSFDGRDDEYVHPEFLGVVPLPLVRKFIVPDEGHVFLHRDFDGQELRIFAHFEQGDLWRKYQEDPYLDPHAFVGAELMAVAGREIERTRVKTLNFQSIYGGGVPALQRKLRCSASEAKQLKDFHNRALPGRKILNDEIKRVVGGGAPIRTWGGRLYYPEKPGFSKKHGRYMTYEYKLINYIVQGSAADLTKEALIAWHGNKGSARFMVTVYDEINISSPIEDEQKNMALLREAMELPRLTVPMMSSGKRGPNWGSLTKCP